MSRVKQELIKKFIYEEMGTDETNDIYNWYCKQTGKNDEQIQETYYDFGNNDLVKHKDPYEIAILVKNNKDFDPEDRFFKTLPNGIIISSNNIYDLIDKNTIEKIAEYIDNIKTPEIYNNTNCSELIDFLENYDKKYNAYCDRLYKNSLENVFIQLDIENNLDPLIKLYNKMQTETGKDAFIYSVKDMQKDLNSEDLLPSNKTLEDYKNWEYLYIHENEVKCFDRLYDPNCPIIDNKNIEIQENQHTTEDLAEFSFMMHESVGNKEIQEILNEYEKYNERQIRLEEKTHRIEQLEKGISEAIIQIEDTDELVNIYNQNNNKQIKYMFETFSLGTEKYFNKDMLTYSQKNGYFKSTDKYFYYARDEKGKDIVKSFSKYYDRLCPIDRRKLIDNIVYDFADDIKHIEQWDEDYKNNPVQIMPIGSEKTTKKIEKTIQDIVDKVTGNIDKEEYRNKILNKDKEKDTGEEI